MLVISADPLGNQFVNIAHKIVEALVVHIRIIPLEQRIKIGFRQKTAFRH